MSGDDAAAVTKRTLVFNAFDAALARLDSIPPTGDHLESAFGPLGESIWWAVILDEYESTDPAYNQARNADPDGELLRGLRYARNKLGHNPDLTALVTSCDVVGDVVGSFVGRWCWLSDASLPPSEFDDPRGQQVYQERMEGRSVADTLIHIRRYFMTRVSQGTD